MNCNDCIRANPINRCAATIYIPHVAGPPNEEYLITITNTATGRVESETVTAVGHSLTVPVSFELMNGVTYSIKAYHDGVSNDAHELQVGGETGCCIEFTTYDLNIGGDTDEILNVNPCNSATND